MHEPLGRKEGLQVLRDAIALYAREKQRLLGVLAEGDAERAAHRARKSPKRAVRRR